MRKLARIVKVQPGAIERHLNADTLSIIWIGGWSVVIRTGDFEEGQLAIYCEVDSFVPNEIAPFLTQEGKNPKEYGGIIGERLRTKKLRGILSQGLLLPFDQFKHLIPEYEHLEDIDVTDYLGIVKWEPPIPASLCGIMKGLFPSFVPKTDQLRCQNLVKEINHAIVNDTVFEVTQKIDGSSMTVYWKDGELGVASRNVDLKLDQTGNAYVDMMYALRLDEALCELNQNIAIQGELAGPGIQGNPEKLTSNQFYVFDIWSIDDQRYLNADDRKSMIRRLNEILKGTIITPVRTIHEKTTLRELDVYHVQDLLAAADAFAVQDPGFIHEGMVYKSESLCFKAVSNVFLMKGGH